jgi:ribosomal protein S11
MSNIVINSFNFNTFLKNIKLNKNYIDKLKSQIVELNYNYETTKFNKSFPNVTYIVYIIQNRTNLVMHVANSRGNLMYSTNAYAAGFFGKAKQRAQSSIIKKFLQVLTTSTQLVFLKNKPVALHLTNIGFIKQWVVKKLKNFFFLESVRIFTLVPFNGCRKKKLRRKKIKKS